MLCIDTEIIFIHSTLPDFSVPSGWQYPLGWSTYLFPIGLTILIQHSFPEQSAGVLQGGEFASY